jgi:O-antigen ligase
LDIWYEGGRIFSDNPILGVGSGAFRTAALETGKTAHNFALALLAEVGIVGFGLFIAVLAIAAYHVRLLPRHTMLLWLTVFLIWFIGALTHSWQHLKVTWLCLGLAVCSAAFYGRREDEVPSTEPPAGSLGSDMLVRRNKRVSLKNLHGSNDRHSTT